ncbi:MAG: NUDIX domain-containing protein [Acidimicrobiales bacterium]
MPSADDDETAVSAGGIVVAEVDGTAYVALAMRPDGLWVLPKGGVEDRDADMEATAVREVTEELGLAADRLRVGRALEPYVERTERDGPGDYPEEKVVRLYLMRCPGDALPDLAPDRAHSRAGWWSLAAPLPMLRYREQRLLLERVAAEDLGLVLTFE